MGSFFLSPSSHEQLVSPTADTPTRPVAASATFPTCSSLALQSLGLSLHFQPHAPKRALKRAPYNMYQFLRLCVSTPRGLSGVICRLEGRRARGWYGFSPPQETLFSFQRLGFRVCPGHGLLPSKKRACCAGTALGRRATSASAQRPSLPPRCHRGGTPIYSNPGDKPVPLGFSDGRFRTEDIGYVPCLSDLILKIRSKSLRVPAAPCK